MGYTQEQIDALEAALATGTQRVTYENRTTEYRSVAEMEQILNKMKKDVALASGQSRRTRQNISRTVKGL